MNPGAALLLAPPALADENGADGGLAAGVESDAKQWKGAEAGVCGSPTETLSSALPLAQNLRGHV
jgi:hypothetical protein